MGCFGARMHDSRQVDRIGTVRAEFRVLAMPWRLGPRAARTVKTVALVHLQQSAGSAQRTHLLHPRRSDTNTAGTPAA